MAEWGKRNGRSNGQTEEMLAHENQALTENLAHKVSRLKNIAFDIQTETEDQNKYLGGMNQEFDGTEGLLGGSMKRINYMVSAGKSNRKIMCYIILFLVGLFVLLYYIVSRFTAS